MDTTGLPGAELVQQGLADVSAGDETIPALLVLIGGPRLRGLGFPVPAEVSTGAPPEHRLYHLLVAQHGDAAHSRYNALIRRLVSFERAAACVR